MFLLQNGEIIAAASVCEGVGQCVLCGDAGVEVFGLFAPGEDVAAVKVCVNCVHRDLGALTEAWEKRKRCVTLTP